MHRALADRNAPFFVAFAVASNQRSLDIDVAREQTAGFGNSQAGGVHQLDQRAITHAEIRFDVRCEQQLLHLFFGEKLR